MKDNYQARTGDQLVLHALGCRTYSSLHHRWCEYRVQGPGGSNLTLTENHCFNSFQNDSTFVSDTYNSASLHILEKLIYWLFVLENSSLRCASLMSIVFSFILCWSLGSLWRHFHNYFNNNTSQYPHFQNSIIGTNPLLKITIWTVQGWCSSIKTFSVSLFICLYKPYSDW